MGKDPPLCTLYQSPVSLKVNFKNFYVFCCCLLGVCVSNFYLFLAMNMTVVAGVVLHY